MKNTGFNNTTLKQQNRGLLLKLIATGECTSRVELARKTGLSKMAATNIISEFLEDEVIEEKEIQKVNGKGRNPIGLCISGKAPKLVGVYIYRDECTVILCDIQLKILKKVSFLVTAENESKLFPMLCKSIDKVLQFAGKERIYGMGIGSIGPVDVERGMILNPPNFYGKKDMALVALLKEKYQMPVFLDAQYNCAALAEKYYGNGKETEDFLFVGIGNGIGSGVISNGRLQHNKSGLTSEIGHVSIDFQGKLCTCGNRGCLETYVSSRVIEKQLQAETGLHKNFQEFCQLAEDESKETIRAVFQEMTVKLACGITTAVNLYNPEKIIIGHEGYWIPERYREQLELLVNRQKLSGTCHTVKIEKSYFGADTHIRGCACGLLSKIFDGILF